MTFRIWISIWQKGWIVCLFWIRKAQKKIQKMIMFILSLFGIFTKNNSTKTDRSFESFCIGSQCFRTCKSFTKEKVLRFLFSKKRIVGKGQCHRRKEEDYVACVLRQRIWDKIIERLLILDINQYSLPRNTWWVHHLLCIYWLPP